MQTVNKTRYSDQELQEFKALIENKVRLARKEPEDDSPGQPAAPQMRLIEQLEAALTRIQTKTYGICRGTGKLIPIEKLRAVPHATTSMEAKHKQA